MHPRTILAIARKDTIDILLNRSTISILVMPIAVTLLFMLITRLLGAHVTNLLVYNPDHSPVTRILTTAFDRSHITEASSPEEVDAAFGANGTRKSATYDVGLVLPAHFESELKAGKHLQVRLYINGGDINIHDSLLLQTAIVNYARQVANPQPPVGITAAMINPPPSTNVGDIVESLYSSMSLLISFMVGISLMPGLLIEEKERKTLRMLMVSPASFTDVILGKLLVVLVYQLLLSMIVLEIQGGITGQVPLILLYTLIGSCMSLAIGLLLGGAFQTASAAGAVSGMITFIYIIPAFFGGPVGDMLGTNAFSTLVKILPTYYLMDGVYHAMQNLGTPGEHLLDTSVLLGCILVLLALTVWILRRQSSVTASI